jgi:osmotically-inducible protein OsmY
MVRPALNSRIEEAVKNRLQESAYPSIKHLDCEFDDGILVLRGRLPSFFEKQVAQETVAGLDGIKEIVNCVEVN